MTEKLRLGGMALSNGVLVHGPTSWACAVRPPEGELKDDHGAEHIAIGSHEQDAPHAREHERCGTHLVGPLLLTGAAGNVLASRAPAPLRGAARLAATVGALAATTEIFGWMQRNP